MKKPMFFFEKKCFFEKEQKLYVVAKPIKTNEKLIIWRNLLKTQAKALCGWQKHIKTKEKHKYGPLGLLQSETIVPQNNTFWTSQRASITQLDTRDDWRQRRRPRRRTDMETDHESWRRRRKHDGRRGWRGGEDFVFIEFQFYI